MAKISIAREVVQEDSLREGLEAAVREWVREVIELILEEEVDAPLESRQAFRSRVKTQAALPNEGAVLRVFFGFWISGQIELRRIRRCRDLGGKEAAAA